MKFAPLLATLLAAILAITTAQTSSALACSIPAGQPANRSILDDDTPDCFDLAAREVVLLATNSCSYAVTLEPLDCDGCQPGTIIEPNSTAPYEVPHTEGQDGPNTIGWSSDQGSGTVTYVGSRYEEPPEVDCDDSHDSACSSTAAHPGESPLVAVVLAGMILGLRRRVRLGL